MKDKIYILRFRAVNRGIFEAIKSGKKKVETRAATERYRKIKKGDKVCLACGREKIIKQVVAARVFSTIATLLKKYRPSQINPKIKTEAELRKMCYGDKIKKYGLIAWQLE
jgi:ASC-1-like (ASCH) protein